MKANVSEQSAIDHFNLLCDLDEVKRQHDESKINGSCQNEISDLYQKVKKIDNQIVRHGNKIDGNKEQRCRPPSAATIVINAYLAEHKNCGSVTIADNGVPSLFDWAYKNTGKFFGEAEIVAVTRHESISFAYNGGTAKVIKVNSLKPALSNARKFMYTSV